jgi:hypothetical protein
MPATQMKRCLTSARMPTGLESARAAIASAMGPLLVGAFHRARVLDPQRRRVEGFGPAMVPGTMRLYLEELDA